MSIFKDIPGSWLADDLAMRSPFQEVGDELVGFGIEGSLQSGDVEPLVRSGEVLPAVVEPSAVYGGEQESLMSPVDLSAGRLPMLAYFKDPGLLDEENGLYAEISSPALAGRKREEAVLGRFLSDHFGFSEEDEVDLGFLSQQYAREELSLTGPMETSAMYKEVQRQLEDEEADEKLAVAAMGMGYEASLKGEDGMAALGGYQAEENGVFKEARSRHAKAFLEGFNVGASVLDPLRGEMKEAISARGRIMGNEAKEGDEKIVKRFINKLVEMPDEKTSIFLASLHYQAEDEGKLRAFNKGGIWGFVSQAGEAAYRMANDMTVDHAGVEMDSSIVSATGEVKWSRPITSLAEARAYVEERSRKNTAKRATGMAHGGRGGMGWGPDYNEPTIVVTPEMTVLINEAKRLKQKSTDMERVWTQLERKSDPVVNRWADFAGKSGSVVGVIGLSRGRMLPVLGKGYANAEYERLRYEYPEMDRGDAGLLAVGHGGINMLMDAVAPGILSKVPGLKSVLQSGTASLIAKRLAVRTVAQGGIETAIGTVQNYTTPVLQTVLSALKKEVQGYDWENDPGFWYNYKENLPFTLAMTLVFAGKGSLRDYRDVGNVRRFNNELGAMGIVEKDRVAIHEALRKGKFDDADALMRDASQRLDSSISDFYQERLVTQQESDARVVQERMREARVELLHHDGLWVVRTPETQAYFTDAEAALKGWTAIWCAKRCAVMRGRCVSSGSSLVRRCRGSLFPSVMGW